MIRLLTWLMFLSVPWGLQAQSLREAVSLMLARDGERGVGQAGLTAGGDLKGGEDPVNRELNQSLRSFLDVPESRDAMRVAQHRQAMQEYLENAVLEDRVVELAETYVGLVSVDRRKKEWQVSLASYEALGGQAGAGEMGEALRARVEARKKEREELEAEQGRAEERFKKLVGKDVGGLILPPVPVIPVERGEVDLSGNWNYLASLEAVHAAEPGEGAGSRERMPEILRVAGAGGLGTPEGVGGSPDSAGAELLALRERKAAWQAVKAQELHRAADLQRRYVLSRLWRERQADLVSLASLRTQTAILAGAVNGAVKEYSSGRRMLLEVIGLHEKLDQARVRLIETESSLLVGAFRILGVQGRCVEFVMGEGYLDRQFLGEENPEMEAALPGADLTARQAGSGDSVRVAERGRME